MSFRDKRYKTPEYKEWHYQIQNYLQSPKNQSAFKQLRESFDPDKHFYSVCLTFYYPEHILFTQKGNMSAKAHDCSNIEKPLIDILFLPSNNKVCPNLNVDDKYIADLSSRKRPLDQHMIEVEMEILELRSIQRDVS